MGDGDLRRRTGVRPGRARRAPPPRGDPASDDARYFLSDAVSAPAAAGALADRFTGAVVESDPSALYDTAVRPEVGRGFAPVRARRACANTGCARRRRRRALTRATGSEVLYARVIEPVDAGRGRNLDLRQRSLPRARPVARRPRFGPAAGGDGLARDRADLALSRPARNAGLLWRRAVLRPGADRHARPDRGPGLETALLMAWARRRFGGTVAVAGISMTLVRGAAGREPLRASGRPSRGPTAVMLISHSGRHRGGDLRRRASRRCWASTARCRRPAGRARRWRSLSRAIDPASGRRWQPARIVSVLGETDRWVPYADGLALARQWQAAGREHLPLPPRPSRHAGPADARSGAVRAAQAGVARAS